MHDALTSADLPDVLLLGYSIRKNGRERLFRGSTADILLYSQRGLLLSSPWNSPWSKVVKADMLPKYAEEKWVGAEDTWNWLLMLSQHPRIAQLKECAYIYCMDNPACVSRDTALVQAGKKKFLESLKRIEPVIKLACPELLPSVKHRMKLLVNTFGRSREASGHSISAEEAMADQQKTISFYQWRPESTPVSKNFGDHCVPAVLSALLPKDTKVVFSRDAKPGRLVSVGSLLGNSNKIYSSDIIWGTGFMYHGRKASAKPTVKMTRGPLSQLQLEASGVKCPSVYGDPGIFIPYAFKAVKSREPKKHEFGIIPHFHDMPKAKQCI